MLPRLAILAAAVLWSTAGAAIKLCHLDGWQIAGGRSLVAAVVLLLVDRGTRVVPSARLGRVALAYAATVVLFVLANKRTTAANAIFIQDTAPLYVLLLGPWLVGDRPSRRELWAAPLYVVGLGLFFGDQLTAGQQDGNFLALASGVAFALTILGLRSLRGGGANAATMMGNVIAFMVTLPVAVQGPPPTAGDVGILLYLGVFQLALAYALFAWGLRKVSAVEGSLLMLLEPVLSPVWAFLLAGERPGPWALAGGTVVLAATAWQTVQSMRRPRGI